MSNLSLGLIDNWLRHVQDVMHKHEETLSQIEDDAVRLDRLCELNVIEQVLNVSKTTSVEGAWKKGQELAIHGWIYGLKDGLLREMNISVTGHDGLSTAAMNAYSHKSSNWTF